MIRIDLTTISPTRMYSVTGFRGAAAGAGASDMGAMVGPVAASCTLIPPPSDDPQGARLDARLEPGRRVGVAIHLGRGGGRHLHPDLVTREPHRVAGRRRAARLRDHQLEHPAHAAHDPAPRQDEHVEQAVRGVEREARPEGPGDRLAAVRDEHDDGLELDADAVDDERRRLRLEARQQPARGKEVGGDPVAALLLPIRRRDELGIEPRPARDAEAHAGHRSALPGRRAARRTAPSHDRRGSRRPSPAPRAPPAGRAARRRPSRTGCRCRRGGCPPRRPTPRAPPTRHAASRRRPR